MQGHYVASYHFNDIDADVLGAVYEQSPGAHCSGNKTAGSKSTSENGFRLRNPDFTYD